MTINGKKIKEEWKPVKGFERLYEVSNLGRVKSLSRKIRANTCGVRTTSERILSNCINSSGYVTVILCNKGKHKTFSVHRIVAENFIPNPCNYNEVNHKDENKQNNCIDNLEWCNQKYNANYGNGIEKCRVQKFKKVDMIEPKTLKTIRTFESALQAQQVTSISRQCISSVCLGKTKMAGGYIWRFVNGD